MVFHEREQDFIGRVSVPGGQMPEIPTLFLEMPGIPIEMPGIPKGFLKQLFALVM